MSTRMIYEPLSPPASSAGFPENLHFDDPDADIVLRSCDRHEFRVLKLHVTKVSLVLQDLIQSASTPHATNTTASLPSVQLSESGATLSCLLTFILPMVPVIPSTIEQTMTLLSTAHKYQMVPILSRIRAALISQDPPFIHTETAFQVYSLAQTYGLRQEVLQAARYTLSRPFNLEELEDEIDKVRGIHLHELCKYHHRVRAHLANDLTAFKASGVPREKIGQPCNNGTPYWLGQYIDSIAESPALFDITELQMSLLRHINARPSRCRCAEIPTKAIHAFWMTLTSIVYGCMRKAGSEIVIQEGPRNGPSPCPRRASPLPDHLDMSDADMIIQSCDIVNFRIHKSALSLSSPFFRDMFSPQPAEDGKVVNGLPVVHLAEDAEVLNSLLTMLYPIPSVLPNSYDKSLMLLAVSQKYDMVGVQARIRAEIQSRKFPAPTGTATFRAYAIASSGGLRSETETSARLTLYFPMTFEYLCDALPLFEGRALRDLIGFRKRCRDNFVSCFRSFLDLCSPPFNIWMSCADSYSYSYSNYRTGYSPSWLIDFFQQRLDALGQAFTKPLPNPSNIREEYLSALQEHITSYGRTSCVTCTKVHAMNGETFCKELEKRLMQAIDKL